MSTATLTLPPPLVTALPTISPLEFAVQAILGKQSKKAILSQLSIKYGLSSQDALAITRHAYGIKHAAFRKAGVKTLFIGIAMLIIGVLITAGTYSMVSEKGGTYFVTYGLIVVGAVKILQGLFMILLG